MKIILFTIALLIYYNGYSQSHYKAPIPPFVMHTTTETVDSGNIRVYYALNALDIGNLRTYDDCQRLEIGYNISKYYSDFVWVADSTNTEMAKKNTNKHSESIGGLVGGYFGKKKFWFEYQYSEYFKDFSTNKLTEYSRMPMYIQKQNCKSEEDIPVQDWTLYDDTLTIIGYTCQKATCCFRGRNYTAWFTVDIPVSNGPWKFGGLPGLILKVSDNDNLWVFECIAIKNYTKKFPILSRVSFKKYPQIERTKLLKFHNTIHENYLQVSGLILVEAGKNQPEKNTHQPLELE
jgi:GLPGLI family protein